MIVMLIIWMVELGVWPKHMFKLIHLHLMHKCKSRGLLLKPLPHLMDWHMYVAMNLHLNDIKHRDTSRNEVVMDALFTKEATPHYEGCSSSMLLDVVVIEFEHNAWCIKQFHGWTFFTIYCKKNYCQKTTRC